MVAASHIFSVEMPLICSRFNARKALKSNLRLPGTMLLVPIDECRVTFDVFVVSFF